MLNKCLKKSQSLMASIFQKKTSGAPFLAPPPVLMAATTGLGFVLNWFLPLGLSNDSSSLKWLALVFALTALILGFYCVAIFYRNKTSFHPGGHTEYIVIGGPYRFSRNPMYLSLLMLQLSLAMYFMSLWLLLTLPLLQLLLLKGVILPEEQYLDRRFGESYLKYKSQVRRWI